MKNFTRRKFIVNTSAVTAGTLLSTRVPVFGASNKATVSGLALKGGTPVRTNGWLEWPVWDAEAEEPVLSVLRSGDWYRARGTKVDEFEKAYADFIGARRTTALETALHVLGVDAGDEVIVSPYTFIATYNVVLNQKALPVFADTDQETFTINPHKIEEKITEHTTAILPVHILGLPADMNRINAIARKHDLVVIEDACQAWLAGMAGVGC